MIRAVFALVVIAFATSAYGQMYKWTDKDGKVHYSDTPPPQDSTQLRVAKPPQRPPSGAEATGKGAAGKPESKAEGQPPVKFRPEEDAALGALCGLAFTQFGCMLELNRYCTLEEMIKGGPGGKPKGFEKDPRQDPNYEYGVEIRGSAVSFSATPRKPGLAGFFNPGDGTRYNPGGRATASDKLVRGGVNCQGFTK